MPKKTRTKKTTLKYPKIQKDPSGYILRFDDQDGWVWISPNEAQKLFKELEQIFV